MREVTTGMTRESTRAIVALLVVWLAFAFPAFAGQVRFPVDFNGPDDPAERGRPANVEQGDAYYAMYPWHEYLGDRLRSGRAPLWDPHRFAGTPFAADIGVGAWYPPNWLYAAGNPLAIFTLIGIASSLSALLVTYWFLRVLELHPYAAALGAIVFSFSAFLVKWATNETVMGSAIWMALPLGGLEVARRGRRWRGAVIAAVGLSLVVLGGHAQIALYVWSAAGLWAALALAGPRVRSRLAARRGRGGAAAGAGADSRNPVARLVLESFPAMAAVALAVGLSAVQLLPALELSGHIVRQRTTWERASMTFLPVEHLPTILVPDHLGNPVDGNYDGPGVNYTETALYAGVLTLPLALFGAFHRSRRAALFFGVLVAVGFLAVLGSPLYRVILALPGFSRTDFATRFILFVDFGLAGLAALGLDRLLRGGPPARRALLLLGASLVAVVGLVLWLALDRPGTPLPGSYLLSRGARTAALAGMGAAALAVMVRVPSRAGRMALVVVAVVAGDLWVTGFRFNPFHSPRPVYLDRPATDALARAPGVRPRFAEIGPSFNLPPNAALVHGFFGVGGYDPLIPRSVVELIGLEEDQQDRARVNFLGPFRPGTAAAPVFDLLGVSRLVGPASAPVDGRPVVVDHFAVFERPGSFPPAFLTSCWEVVPERRALGRLAAMSSSELRGTAVVADTRGARRALGRTGPVGCGPAGEATIERYEPERVSLRARTDQSAVLVLTDTWFPGWEATVDGTEVPVLKVDHALRGVALGPGDHQVEFRFRPASLRYGTAATAATLLLLDAVGVLAVVMRRARPVARAGRRLPAPRRRPPGRPSSRGRPRGRPPDG